MAKLEVRPTLIIGLGGTGVQVALQLKARFQRNLGRRYARFVRLLCFDTDENQTSLPIDDQNIALEGNEFTYIGGIETTTILSNVEGNYPHLMDWLPNNMPARSILRGAGQVRPLGRLAFMIHYNDIRSRIDTAIQELRHLGTHQIDDDDVTVSRSHTLNIFIIASVCGGTGSSTFIDTAYVTRYIAQSQGIREDHVFINGMLALPLVYKNVPGDRIQENSFAALKELDSFNSGELHYKTSFNSRAEVDIIRPPFNICYLVDTANEEGYNINGIQQLSPMMADAIMQQFSSQIGTAGSSSFDNIGGVITKMVQIDHEFSISAYSGLGTARLVFPAEMIQKVIGATVLTNILKRLSDNSKLETVNVENLIGDFVAGNALDIAQMNGKLRRTEKSAIGQKIPESLVDVPPNKVQAHITTTTRRFLNEQVEGRWVTVIEENTIDLEKKLQDAFLDSYASVLRENGLAVCRLYLKGLMEYIKNLRDNVSRLVAEEDTRIRQAQTDSEGFLESVQKSRTVFGMGGGEIRRQGTKFLSSENRRFNAMMKRDIYQALSRILSQLNQEIRKREIELGQLEDRMFQLNQKFTHDIGDYYEDYDPRVNPLVNSIVQKNDIDVYYNRYIGKLDAVIEQLYQEVDGISEWMAYTYDDLQNKLEKFGRGLCKNVRTLNIETVLKEKTRNEAEFNSYLDHILSLAIPFWNVQRQISAEVNTNLENYKIQVVGVPNHFETTFNDEGVTIVSTQDPHSIVALHTKHGLPLKAMTQYRDWERAYNDYLNREDIPLHIFRFVDDDVSKVAFALGLAFDIIKSKGNHYSFYPDDEFGLEPKELWGHGLENAYGTMANSKEKVTTVQNMVDQRFRDMGEVQALEIVDKFIETATTQDFMLDLRRKVRDWRKQRYD